MKIFAVIVKEVGFKEKTTHHIDGERRDMEDDAAPMSDPTKPVSPSSSLAITWLSLMTSTGSAMTR
jgi:hypothetical protein